MLRCSRECRADESSEYVLDKVRRVPDTQLCSILSN